MGKSTISMAIFHSYVKLPEGTQPNVMTCNDTSLLKGPKFREFSHSMVDLSIVISKCLPEGKHQPSIWAKFGEHWMHVTCHNCVLHPYPNHKFCELLGIMIPNTCNTWLNHVEPNILTHTSNHHPDLLNHALVSSLSATACPLRQYSRIISFHPHENLSPSN